MNIRLVKVRCLAQEYKTKTVTSRRQHFVLPLLVTMIMVPQNMVFFSDLKFKRDKNNLLLYWLFQTKENPTFKDNDFTKDNAKLRIGDEVKKDLLQRVKDDVEVSWLVKWIKLLRWCYMSILSFWSCFWSPVELIFHHSILLPNCGCNCQNSKTSKTLCVCSHCLVPFLLANKPQRTFIRTVKELSRKHLCSIWRALWFHQ